MHLDLHRSFTSSAILFVVTIALTGLIARRGQPIVIRTNLENLPMEIEDFKGTEDAFAPSVYAELKADKHVYRHYSRSGGGRVDLYIGYYGTAKGGRTPHNPYGCLPGAGWGLCEAGMVRLQSPSFPDGVTVNYLLARKGERFETILHWYQSAGTKVLSTGIHQNLQRFWGKVFYNRNDGAFVRVSLLTGQAGVDEADRTVKCFAEKILDLLPGYWPVEE